jgi:hypothetical protein
VNLRPHFSQVYRAIVETHSPSSESEPVAAIFLKVFSSPVKTAFSAWQAGDEGWSRSPGIVDRFRSDE